MKKLLLIILLFFPATAYAGDWNKVNTALELSHAAVLTLDWGQTRWIAANPQSGYFERVNPYLGKHPSVGKVDTWFIAWELLHPAISYLIPNPYRYIWQGLTLACEVDLTAHNYAIGIGVKF